MAHHPRRNADDNGVLGYGRYHERVGGHDRARSNGDRTGDYRAGADPDTIADHRRATAIGGTDGDLMRDVAMRPDARTGSDPDAPVVADIQPWPDICRRVQMDPNRSFHAPHCTPEWDPEKERHHGRSLALQILTESIQCNRPDCFGAQHGLRAGQSAVGILEPAVIPIQVGAKFLERPERAAFIVPVDGCLNRHL